MLEKPKINSMLNRVDGYKTYLVCLLGVVWAFVGLGMGWLESDQAMTIVLASLGGAGLRHGMN